MAQSSTSTLPTPLTLLDDGSSVQFIPGQEVLVSDAKVPTERTDELQAYAQAQGLTLRVVDDDLILHDEDTNAAIRIVGQLAGNDREDDEEEAAEATSLAGDGSGDAALGGGAGTLAISAPQASLAEVTAAGAAAPIYGDLGLAQQGEAFAFSALGSFGDSAAEGVSSPTGDDSIFAGAGDDLVTGGPGNDMLSGGDGADTLSGGAGNDSLFGGAGNDLLSGGAGDDSLSGGADADTLSGGAGNDLLDGGDGNDLLSGGAGDDSVAAGDGNDTLYGGPGRDLLDGGAGNDLVLGGGDADTLLGGTGNDTLSGGAGDDSISGGEGNDGLYGGEGADALSGGVGNDVLEGNAGSDQLSGGSGDDSLSAGDGDDTLYGGPGRDLLDGGDGNDLAYGGGDADTLLGGDGNDTLSGGDGSDSMNAGLGSDLVYGNAGADALSGGDGDDTLFGGTDDDTLSGGGGADRLVGGQGADTLSGDDGADLLEGAAGRDTLNGGEDNDVLVGGDGNDSLSGAAGADTLSGGAGDDLQWGGDGADTLLGQAGNDVLSGGADADLLSGGDGADALAGGDGSDSLSGGGGADVLSGGIGNDQLFGGLGQDVLSGGAGDDSLRGGDDADSLDGGIDSDALSGGAGDDRLHGDAGADTLLGQAGNDVLSGGAGADLLSGGEGDDGVLGGDGADTLSGGAGADALSGGAGNDLLVGGAGADTLDGGAGNDSLSGGAGSDVHVLHLDAADGQDTISDFVRGEDRIQLLGGDVLAAVADAIGSQTVAGGGLEIDIAGETVRIEGVTTELTVADFGLSSFAISADKTSADEGTDLAIVYTVTRGGDTALAASVGIEFGGSAVAGDHYVNPGDVTVTFAAGETQQTVTLTLLDDQIIQPDRDVTATLVAPEGGLVDAASASAATAILDDDSIGSPGDDTINGSDGSDTLSGGEGNDQISGGLGDDVIHGGAGSDTLSGGAGNDSVVAGDGDDLVSGGDGSDTLSGGLGDDQVAGGDGNDVIYGGDGNDTLAGDGGNDTVIGGEGDDLLEGGAGNDTLSGGAGNDTVLGNGGDDLLDGGADGDQLSGGLGVDTIRGGDGADILSGGDGADTLSGGAGEDLVVGGGGVDLLSGGNGADTLSGGDGSDSLTGGLGNDLLEGGAGNDTFAFADDGGNDTVVGFVSGADRIALLGSDPDDLAVAAFQGQQLIGEDVVFDVGSATVAIAGRAELLTAADFGLSTFSLSTDVEAASEGEAQLITYTVTRGGDVDRAASVAIGLGGSAVAGTDFEGSGEPLTVTFAAGETSRTVTVQLLDDAASDGSKTLTASLVGAEGGIVTGSISVDTVITDDDLAVRVATTSVREGSGPAPLVFELTEPVTAGDVTVRYQILSRSSDTASAGVDFQAVASGELTIPAGSTSASMLLALLDDSAYEGNETLTVRITEVIAPSGLSIGGDGDYPITIEDNEAAPLLTISGADVLAEDGSLGSPTITIRKSGSTDIPATVRIVSSDGGLDQILTFGAGEIEKTVLYAPVDNALADGARVVTVSMVEASGAEIAGTGVHSIQILDDESATFIAGDHDGQGPDTITGTAGEDIIEIGSSSSIGTIHDITILPLAGTDYVDMRAQDSILNTTIDGAGTTADVVHLTTVAGQGIISGTTAELGDSDDSVQVVTSGGTLGQIGSTSLALGDGANQVRVVTEVVVSSTTGAVAGRILGLDLTAGAGADRVQLFQEDLSATNGAESGRIEDVSLALGDGDNVAEIHQLNNTAGTRTGAVNQDTGDAALMADVSVVAGSGGDVLMTLQQGASGVTGGTTGSVVSAGGSAAILSGLTVDLGGGDDLWRHTVLTAAGGDGAVLDSWANRGRGVGDGGDAGVVDGAVASLGQGTDRVELRMSAIRGGDGAAASVSAPETGEGTTGGDGGAAAIVDDASLDFGGAGTVVIELSDAIGGTGAAGSVGGAATGSGGSTVQAGSGGNGGSGGDAGAVDGLSVAGSDAGISIALSFAQLDGGDGGDGGDSGRGYGDVESNTNSLGRGGEGGSAATLRDFAATFGAGVDTLSIAAASVYGGDAGDDADYGSDNPAIRSGGDAAHFELSSYAFDAGTDVLSIAVEQAHGGAGGAEFRTNYMLSGGDGGVVDAAGSTIDLGEHADAVSIVVTDSTGGDAGRRGVAGGAAQLIGGSYLLGGGGDTVRVLMTGNAAGQSNSVTISEHPSARDGDVAALTAVSIDAGDEDDVVEISMDGNTGGYAADVAVVDGTSIALGAGHDRLSIILGANAAASVGSGRGNVIADSSILAGSGNDLVQIVARGATGTFGTAQDAVIATTVALGTGSDRLEIDALTFSGMTVDGGVEAATRDTLAFTGQTSTVDLRSGATAVGLASIEDIDLAADAGSTLTLDRQSLLQADASGSGDRVLRIHGDDDDIVVFDVGAGTLAEVGTLEDNGVTYRRFANDQGGSVAYLEVQQGIAVNPLGFERTDAFLGDLGEGEIALRPAGGGALREEARIDDLAGMDARWSGGEPVTVGLFFEPGRLDAEGQATFEAAVDSWLAKYSAALGLDFARYDALAGDTMHDNGADIAVGIGRGYLAGIVGSDQVGRYGGISMGLDPSQVGISLGNAGIARQDYATAEGDIFLHDGLAEIGLGEGSFGYYVIGQELYHSLGGGELDDTALASLGLDPASAHRSTVADEAVPVVTATDFAADLSEFDIAQLQRLYGVSDDGPPGAASIAADFRAVEALAADPVDDDHQHTIASVA